MADLDKNFPRFVAGESLELKKRDGIPMRGTFVESKGDAIVVLRAGARVEVPYRDLDQSARTRADAAYRESLIASLVKQRVEELQKKGN